MTVAIWWRSLSCVVAAVVETALASLVSAAAGARRCQRSKHILVYAAAVVVISVPVVPHLTPSTRTSLLPTLAHTTFNFLEARVYQVRKPLTTLLHPLPFPSPLALHFHTDMFIKMYL